RPARAGSRVSARTRCPAARSCSTRGRPMLPVAPVTRIVTVSSPFLDVAPEATEHSCQLPTAISGRPRPSAAPPIHWLHGGAGGLSKALRAADRRLERAAHPGAGLDGR